MKWKNIDQGPGYYYITATLTEWVSLFARDDLRNAVVHEIKIALSRFRASLAAFVIMPDHLHLLTFLPEDGQLHRFCKCWRGRSGRRVVDLLIRQQDTGTLRKLAAHANGRCRYAAWKEQVRALPISNVEKLRAKIDYIHANPVGRGLVADPTDWDYSSYRFYERGDPVVFDVASPEI